MVVVSRVRPVTTGDSVGSHEPPPPHAITLVRLVRFLYVFRKLDCHNFSLLFKLHEICRVDSQ